MTYEEYKRLTAEGSYLAAGSDVHKFMHFASQQAITVTMEINSRYHTPQEIRELFSELVGYKVDEGFGLFPPFYTDFGKNIKLGKNVFINAGCCFQDQGGIELGDGCLIGHQVVIATLNHDMCPERRGGMFPKKVVLGKNVWVGAHATILPGVTIGDNAVIAAGAVVTKYVPANSVVGGVPAKVLKMIEE